MAKIFNSTEESSKKVALTEEKQRLLDEYNALTGTQKAAIVLVSLGTNTSSQIFAKLSDYDIERLSTEVAKTENVHLVVKEMVLEEFNELLMAQKFVAQGGIHFAERVLIEALGEEKAKSILARVKSSIKKTGFDLLGDIETEQVVTILQNEHPQTIALLLAHLSPVKAANILSCLNQESQVEVTVRLATMGSISPDVIDQLESVLSDQIKGLAGGAGREVGGVNAVAQIMNTVDMATEKSVMGILERDNPELATTIKNLMFVFDDIILIDDRGVQRILRDLDTKELTLALKGAEEPIREKFLSNMSTRAAEMLVEEIEILGPVRVKDVEEAQQRIIEIVRQLEDSGEIIISGRGGENEMIL